MWSCLHCTLRNPDTRAVCEACAEPRPVQVSAAARIHDSSSSSDDDEVEELPMPLPKSSPKPTAAAASVQPATKAVNAAVAAPAAAASVSRAHTVAALPPRPTPAATVPAQRASSAAASPPASTAPVVAATAAIAADGLSKSALRAVAQASKARSKQLLRDDKTVQKLVAQVHRGAFAEQEITVMLHAEFREAKFSRLLSGLQESKLSYSFPTLPAAASSAASSAAASSSAAIASAAAPPSACSPSSVNVMRTLPRCVLWERRQAPSAVATLRAHKRARLAPPDQWKTLEEEAALAAAHARSEAAEAERRRAAGGGESDSVDELPPPAPVGCVVCMLSASEFLSLYATQQLSPSIARWLACLSAHAQGGKTLLLLVHGLYAQVQMEATQALQQRRAEVDARAENGQAAPARSPRPEVKPLKKLTEVDALLAQLWFQHSGKVHDESECLSWLVSLSLVLSKAPYKETDSALTLVNTGRTDRMRGGDDFRMRASPAPASDDSDDERDDSRRRKRQAAQSTLAESWRLFLMQIPRMSERIAVCLTRQYPTLRSLWDAYVTCVTDKQREGLVQDVLVSSGAAAGAKAVRVGPALSKALYQSVWLQHAPVQRAGSDAPEAGVEDADVDM